MMLLKKRKHEKDSSMRTAKRKSTNGEDNSRYSVCQRGIDLLSVIADRLKGNLYIPRCFNPNPQKPADAQTKPK